jgi:hypothetical protein
LFPRLAVRHLERRKVGNRGVVAGRALSATIFMAMQFRKDDIVTTHRTQNGLLLAVLGLSVASFFAACSSDDGEAKPDSGTDAGKASVDLTPVGPTTLFDFASSAQDWFFNDYQSMGDGGPSSPLNLASSAVTVTGARPTITWEPSIGNPAPGSLKVSVTFTGYDQNVLANVQFKPAAQDWTNKVVSMRIKFVPGFEELYTGGMQLFAQDESWAGIYQWKNWPADNEWSTYELDMTMSAMKTNDVVQFGIQLISGSAVGATLDDLGNPIFKATTVTAYIDDITVR